MIPVIETERLLLRGMAERDLDAVADFYASPRSALIGGPVSRNDAWRRIATVLGHWVLRGFGMFAVEEKATGQAVGMVGPWFPEGWPEPEIGWTVFDAAEGRGIAYEAATAARAWTARDKGWTTAISLIADDNARSRTLAQRLGCHLEAPFQHAEYGAMGVWRHPAEAFR